MNHIPTNALERAFAVMVAALAMVVNPFIVSRITSSMVALENLRRGQLLRSQQLSFYLHRHFVSNDLRLRIRSFPELTLDHNEDAAALAKILKKLPTDLFVSLKVEIMSPPLRRHALLRFVAAGQRTSAAEMTLASDGAEDRVLSRGQKLFGVGPEAKHMYFILRGELSYPRQDFDIQATDWETHLSAESSEAGRWLSEHALWLAAWEHLGLATAGQKGFCEVLSLNAAVFQRAFGDSVLMKRYAKSFLDELWACLCCDLGNSDWSEGLVRGWLQECDDSPEVSLCPFRHIHDRDVKTGSAQTVYDVQETYF
jgi:hypothetical protein